MDPREGPNELSPARPGGPCDRAQREGQGSEVRNSDKELRREEQDRARGA